LNAEKSFSADTTSTGYFGFLKIIFNSIFSISLYLFGHNVVLSDAAPPLRRAAN
jgi:hypothetical protein